VGNHPTKVAPKSDDSFLYFFSFALGSQPFQRNSNGNPFAPEQATDSMQANIQKLNLIISDKLCK